ncbi:MAG: hypothetical protein A0129_12170 [Limnobacter sp. CACIAM 66H1]|jgi:hypothetical protein|uniref:phage tail assembly chaperone n=1 Tax=Limnobacter sp. CACIAM 66H1 TaxID=1813033 RepID=UPI0007A8247B|nr:phage tail assembly chaperone [Limnobacter sp. CACIAM 66H1]KYP10546.1 MAG: hypothetical protein A0129_12170 [Limnobacter sp. CACIAM 66H1]
MPFKLKLSPTYSTPVNIEIPVDGGRFEKSTFDAEFKRLTTDELNALLARQQEANRTDQDMIADVLVGWKGLRDEDDQEVPFSETNREALFKVVQAVPALTKAFFTSIANVRQKN